MVSCGARMMKPNSPISVHPITQNVLSMFNKVCDCASLHCYHLRKKRATILFYLPSSTASKQSSLKSLSHTLKPHTANVRVEPEVEKNSRLRRRKKWIFSRFSWLFALCKLFQLHHSWGMGRDLRKLRLNNIIRN